MGELHVHEFMTFDGVIDEPSWTEGYEFTEGMHAVNGRLAERCSDLLFGRRTYEMFEVGWADRSAEDDALAPFMNQSPKHVVSGTLTDPTWPNTSVLGPYDPGAIRALKQGAEGDVFTSASGTLVRQMIADGLVDQLHLFVYPLTRGSGPQLFPQGSPPTTMRLDTCEHYKTGVVYLNYRLEPQDRL